jgi:ABC-type Mn2+/Zn2+ transport system ATPase subunit
VKWSFPYGGAKRCMAPVAGAPAVELIDVTAGYGRGQRAVLQNVSLSIPARTSTTLVGPNGCGKSTLLKTITGVLVPEKGIVRTFGHGQGLCHHRVAYLPQRDQVQWQFPISVSQVVMAGRYVHMGWFGRPKRSDLEAVGSALDLMDMTDLSQRQIHDLSGGQRQRVMIARALAQEADLFLFDEPLNALDAEAKTTLCETLGRLAKLGKTIVVATHEFTGFEGLFQNSIRMEQGSILSVDSLEPVGMATA